MIQKILENFDVETAIEHIFVCLISSCVSTSKNANGGFAIVDIFRIGEKTFCLVLYFIKFNSRH